MPSLATAPLLGNYLAHVGMHHWQNNFMFDYVYFSQQFRMTALDESRKIKGKTTWSQRTSNWSYHSNRYKTIIQKTHLHDTSQKVPIICTRSNNHRLAFNQNSDEFVCLDFPADLRHQVVVSSDTGGQQKARAHSLSPAIPERTMSSHPASVKVYTGRATQRESENLTV